MPDLPTSEGLLLLPHIQIQNANAISSSLTWGFPSITAFAGLMWALERRCQCLELPLIFESVGVVCHSFQTQVSHAGFHNIFCLTRNPLDKDGSSASIIEEGRMHLDISLLFGVSGTFLTEPEETKARIAQTIMDILSAMRIAGGSVLPSRRYSRLQPYFFSIPENEENSFFDKLRYQLLPGFTLVERPDLLEKRLDLLRQERPEATPLDAWLSLSRFNWKATQENSPSDDSDSAPKVKWQHDRKNAGWIVPIPLGYTALTQKQEAGTVERTRDPNIPFYFVESVYGIGEWIAPHRLNTIKQLLWYAKNEEGLFRCYNSYINFL